MGYGVSDAPLMNTDKPHISQAMPLMMTLDAVTLQQRQGEEGLSLDVVSAIVKLWKAIGVWVRGNNYLRGQVEVWSRPDFIETLSFDAIAVVRTRLGNLQGVCMGMSKSPNKFDNWRRGQRLHRSRICSASAASQFSQTP